MVIIKLCYSSKLPMPEELIKKIDNNKNNVNTDKSNGKATYKVDTVSNLKDQTNQDKLIPNDVDEMLSLLINNKEAYLHAQIINNIFINDFKPGKIELELNEKSDKDLISRLSKTLENITKIKWEIVEIISNKKETIAEKRQRVIKDHEKQIIKEPIIGEIFNKFPDAEIKKIDN